MIWILVIVFVFLWWQKTHPYIITRDQMKAALERALEGKIPEREWLKLIRRSIPRDRYLDTFRRRVHALPLLVTSKEGGLLYAPTEMAKLATLLEELRRKPTGHAPPPLPPS